MMINLLKHKRSKMVAHALKILQYLLQDFKVCLTIVGHEWQLDMHERIKNTTIFYCLNVERILIY